MARTLEWEIESTGAGADVDDDTFASVSLDPHSRRWQWSIDGFRSDKNIADILAHGWADTQAEAIEAAQAAL